MSLTVLNKDGSVMGSTRNLNLESYQNPYASQPQTPPFGRVNSTAAMPKPTPGQGGIPQDAIFRSATPSTGGTKSPDMSIYSPGRAQPVQSQSTGTPYGVYAPGTTAADIAKQPYTDHMQPNPLYGKYAPGTTAADIAQQPYTDVMTPNPSYAGSARPQAPQRFDSVLAADAPWWAGELGNLPHNPADNRPAYGPTGTATGANAGNFQPSAPAPQNPFANMAPGVYYGGQQIPGNQQQALATAMAQRDAMSVLVNNNNLQYQMANAFGQDLGRPQFDYGSAMQQARNMVANGFYNPFTQYYNQATDPMNQLGQYAPPTMYNPQPFAPIGGFGVQPPPAPPQAQPEYSYKQVPGSEWDQVQQAWRLPAKPVTQAPFAPPPTPTRAEPPVPRVSPTTPTSGNWIQRPDGQWEETQPKMYGGPDPVLKAPQWKPMYGEYSPTQFYDDNGRAFGGSMSFAPGASAEYQENAYRQFAERMGYYKRDANGNRVGTQPGPRSAPEPRPGPPTQPSGGLPPAENGGMNGPGGYRDFMPNGPPPQTSRIQLGFLTGPEQANVPPGYELRQNSRRDGGGYYLISSSDAAKEDAWLLGPTQPSGGGLMTGSEYWAQPNAGSRLYPQPSPQPTGPSPGMRYVPAEYRDGKLWSDAHYVNEAPPIPEYVPPGMYGRPVLKAPENYYPGFDPRTQDPYGRPLPSRPPASPPPGYGTDPDGRRMILDFQDSDRDGVDDRDQPYPGAPPFRAGRAQPIQPPSQGTPYWMREKQAPQQPRKDPGQEFNERLFKRDADLKKAKREGKVLDANGNFISPKNLPPDLYADWLKTRRPQY